MSWHRLQAAAGVDLEQNTYFWGNADARSAGAIRIHAPDDGYRFRLPDTPSKHCMGMNASNMLKPKAPGARSAHGSAELLRRPRGALAS